MADFIIGVSNKFLELRVTKEGNNMTASDLIIVEEKSRATRFNEKQRLDMDMLCKRLNKSDIKVNTPSGSIPIKDVRLIEI